MLYCHLLVLCQWCLYVTRDMLLLLGLVGQLMQHTSVFWWLWKRLLLFPWDMHLQHWLDD